MDLPRDEWPESGLADERPETRKRARAAAFAAAAAAAGGALPLPHGATWARVEANAAAAAAAAAGWERAVFRFAAPAAFAAAAAAFCAYRLSAAQLLERLHGEDAPVLQARGGAAQALADALLAFSRLVRSRELAWLGLGWACLAFCLLGGTAAFAVAVMLRLPSAEEEAAAAVAPLPINFVVTGLVAYALGMPIALGAWAALSAAGIPGAAAWAASAALGAASWRVAAAVGVPIVAFLLLTLVPRDGECLGCGTEGFFFTRTRCAVGCVKPRRADGSTIVVPLQVAMTHVIEL